jgi:glutathione peroxidase-family protein
MLENTEASREKENPEKLADLEAENLPVATQIQRSVTDFGGVLWDFLNFLVTMDETFIHIYDPETKEQTKQKQANSVALVCERTVLTKRPPIFGGVNVNF